MTVLVLGLAAGIASGLLGVGGGILFVPTLTLFVGLGVVDAEATSLLAIVPVAVIGALNQRRYGNVRVLDALVIGVLAVPSAIVGVIIVTHIPERAAALAFAALMAFTAWRMFVSARRELADERRNGAGH